MSRVVPASAFALGVVRVCVHGAFLAGAAFESYATLGALPATILRPTGVMKLVPWSVYDALLTPGGMLALKALMLVSLLSSTVGWRTVVSTKTSLLLVAFHQGLLRSFGHFNHDEMIAVYFLAVLAFTPCGDAVSVDRALGRPTPERPAFAHAYPILLMQVLLAWVYLSSFLIKVRVAGWTYLSPDNLPALAIFHSLDNLHDTAFRAAFWLPQVRDYLPGVVAVVLAWELLFPLAVVAPRLRWAILGFGVLFHASTIVLMNVAFPYQLMTYVVFIDWDRLGSWSGLEPPART